MQRLVIMFILLCAFTVSAQRKQAWPAKFEGAEKVVYKVVGDVKLHMHIFRPVKQKANTPAIVFFFGGGWKGGTPKQFEQQCRYLASRGMMAMTAEYRIRNLHDTLAKYCVEDGKSAVRWIRVNAKKLGVNPDRIAAGGGSAGGHVAACTGVIKGFETKGENAAVSSVPNAMVLFNPPCVMAPFPGRKDFLNPENIAELRERMGVPPEQLSPWHHVRKGLPPTLVLHGEADPTVKFWTSAAFVKKMKAAGNDAKLAAYPEELHGFFNYGRRSNKMFIATMRRTDEFLTKRGWLQGQPSIERFTGAKVR
ncbi:alpha/beta hydrolase fold domain-containing protein [Verrucomicrobia bacterium]|nr:alpha/beta hydrolase fold domain-containing protein [Verrucomicrobiota bacterium]MDC0218363.1 alpha/beta hydrolase fold domain-containing protein [Verrucomicrobiota bacterium]